MLSKGSQALYDKEKRSPKGAKTKIYHQNNITEKEKSQYARKNTLEKDDESELYG